MQSSQQVLNDSRQVWQLIHNIEKVIKGKQSQIVKIVATMIAGGNILLEDVPGVGKTLLCRTLAKSLHVNFQRLQCTPDILPSDITGVNIFNPKENEFKFVPGPVFTHILLADEINRAAPKAQSALLEAMEEHQVSVDNKTYDLPELFLVLATKNPLGDVGTYPMPVAQLDRFWIRLNMGYPSKDTEIWVVQNAINKTVNFHNLPTVADIQAVLTWRKQSEQIHVEQDLLDAIITKIAPTRNNAQFISGISPRAVIQLVKIAQAMALIQGREYVTWEDVVELSPDVFSHRLILSTGDEQRFSLE